MATSVSLLLTLAVFLISHRHATASEDEIRSLLEFRKGIRSDPSNRIFSTWIFPSNVSACPEAFHGVVCDSSGSNVVAVALDRLNLAGDLKFSTLILLKYLENLTLAGNLLSGRLVPGLGMMKSLQVIDFSGNQFYGPIPDKLTEIWALRYLNLSGNQFSGEVPGEISKLQQLRVLDLRSNQLQGDVKQLIPELRNLEYLDLSGNKFSGSIELSVGDVYSLAKTVIYVNMGRNELEGTFWGNDVMMLFQNLKVLDLSDNAIVGNLPDLRQLPNLQILRLGRNQLTGSVPEGFLQGMVPLQELDISGNQFSGSIPEINSTTLGTLNLSSNSITGSLPSIRNCRTVDLSRNLISGDISVLTTWNTDLEVLDLSSNGLTGSIPNLTHFYKLTFICLRNNSLIGNLPSSFGSFPKLSTVDLSSNRLDGPIPLSFFSSMTLTNLNFSANLLTGPIPLEGFRAAEFLVLSSTPTMESLDLSNNLLTGELPSDIGKWGRLKLVNLACNNLSGQLPTALSRLSGLENLNLSHNGFSGKIPDKLPSSLKFFDVAYNRLSGEIPKNLNDIPDASFSGNDLQPRHAPASSDQGSEQNHRSSRSNIRVAIIVAVVGAATMVAFVILAYRHVLSHDFHVQRGLCGQTVGRDVKLGRLNRPAFFRFRSGLASPASLSFSNDHLLTSNSRSLSGQMESGTEFFGNKLPEGGANHAAAANFQQQDNHATTSGRKSSPGSPILSSPHFQDTLESVTLDVYSPDRFVGELFFLDDSLAFTAEELSRAPAEVLGRSSHGTLYKATLHSRNILTVKWLRVDLVKNKKECAKEIKKIGSIKHQNIARIRAYYWGPRALERLILADYITGDSLALHLYEATPKRYSPLLFKQRLKVALDIARGLMSLHNTGLPHGNLKPSNIILMDPEYIVRLTDYGLHCLMTPAGIAEQILNLRALGYCAPELGRAAKPVPSLRADIYSFGVILMELLTRRSAGNIISGQPGTVDLTDWIRVCDRQGRRMDCIDRDIFGGEESASSMQAMEELLAVSLRCILPVNERPNIRQVFQDICSINV